MGDEMEHGCGFIETNRILAWLLGCLAAWLLGCLAAVGGQSYLPFRTKLTETKSPRWIDPLGAFRFKSLGVTSVR
ncbi:MAG: hypothetical protein ACRERW_18780, partial [Pseudomonas sp.]